MEIEDLRETAALAHLNLNEEELSGALSAFEEMLGYFASMQAADGKDSGPVVGSAVARTVASGHFRGDHRISPCPSRPSEDPGRIEELLDNSGERDGRFVVVPNVL
ncbi:MAG: aspartyl/glutamyl-tRNA amidotransferase subunit C [Treponema sp.]|jgi:aspartyl-tRNA(Asn)/glutamyl-tRNA(Gln) amidotransferase subunit C|nr:aspartyl/glutamyl-tRNA amidotransferase subunit C [Treponema sp.]